MMKAILKKEPEIYGGCLDGNLLVSWRAKIEVDDEDYIDFSTIINCINNEICTDDEQSCGLGITTMSMPWMPSFPNFGFSFRLKSDISQDKVDKILPLLQSYADRGIQEYQKISKDIFDAKTKQYAAIERMRRMFPVKIEQN